MARYLRIDVSSIDNWIIDDEYENETELFRETYEFYHSTFYDEDDGYELEKTFDSVEECKEMWEGSAFMIARII